MSAIDSTTNAGVDEARVRSAISSTARPEPAGAVATTRAFAWRSMLKVRHVPEQLLDVTVTPVMFTLMFTYLFGGAVSGSTSEYRDYIVPGILVQTILFTTVYSGVVLNTDMTKGVVDRFRSLPIWRGGPLVGALLGDSARYVLSGLVIIVLGLILGFRPDGGVVGVVAAMALVIVFAFGMSWVFTTLGLLLRTPNAVLNAGFMGVFPLIFLSNIFVPPSTLPAGLKEVVEVNPISILVTATRDLMAGNPAGSDVAICLAVTAGLTAVFATLTVRLYGRA